MRTADLARAYDLALKHTLFPLHPETPPEGRTLEDLFGGRVDVGAANRRMAELMEAEGLPYTKRTHTYNSRRAQELAKWAESQPGGAGIHYALYRAYFVDGANLADIDTLVGAAERIGLPGDGAREAVESGAFAASVDRDWARSRALGITGVPTFVVGKQGVVGAQPYDVLDRLVRMGGAQPR